MKSPKTPDHGSQEGVAVTFLGFPGPDPLVNVLGQGQ